MANEFIARKGIISRGDITATGSIVATGGFTGSFSGSIGTAETASYVNPLTQSVDISGSLNITSVGGPGDPGIYVYKPGNRSTINIDADAGRSSTLNIQQGGTTQYYVGMPIQDVGSLGSRFAISYQGNPSFIVNGNSGIGIGLPAPTARLHVKGSGTTSSTTTLKVENANASASLAILDDNQVRFYEGGQIKLRLFHSGSGLTTPVLRLSNGPNLGLIFKGLTNTPHIGAYSAGSINFSDIDTTGNIGSTLMSLQFGTDTVSIYGNFTATGDIKTTATSSFTVGYQNSAGNGLIWQGYDGKFSGAIKAVDEQNYQRMGLGFFTGDDQDATTDAQERMRISRAGNVGIGTTSPSYKLDVSGSSRFTDQLNLVNAPLQLSDQYYLRWGSTSRIYGSSASNRIVFETAATERMRIEGGNVGIGTTSPAVPLHVSGTFRHDGSQYNIQLIGGSEIRGSNAVTLRGLNSYAAILAAGSIFHTAGTDHIFRDTNSNALVTIKQAGNVGIGMTPPSTAYRFIVSGSANQWGVVSLRGMADSISPPAYYYSSGNAHNFTRPIITGNNISVFDGTAAVSESGYRIGNNDGILNIGHVKAGVTQDGTVFNISASSVGIGTTSPSYKLHVNGTAQIGEDSSGLNNYLYIQADANKARYIHFKDNAARQAIGFPSGSQDLEIKSLNGGVNSGILVDYTTGRINVGHTDTNDAVLHIQGEGTTSSTVALKVENSNASSSFEVLDDGRVKLPTDVRIYSNTTPFIHNGNSSLFYPNVFIGNNAGNFTSTGTGRNVGIGQNALQDLTTGLQNTGIGWNAGKEITEGMSNTFIGAGAGQNVTTGNSNFGIGAGTLPNITTDNNNVGVGTNVFYNLTSGTGNIGLGYQVFNSLLDGDHNIGMGTQAGRFNQGTRNIAIGYYTLVSQASGSYNTIVGYQALQNNTEDNNVAIGYQAGRAANAGGTNDTGSNSVFLGYQAYPSGANDANEIVIGYQAVGQGSNTVTIGNNSITNTYLKGAVSASSFTGSLEGTASFAVTASYAYSASYEIVKEVSSSYADTASYVNPLNQDVDINGNLTLSSGGYVYGDTTTPYLRLNNSAGALLGYGTSYLVNGGSLQFVAGGQTRFRVSSNGYAGINVGASPTAPWHVKGFGSTSSTTSLLVQNANASSSLKVLDNGDVEILNGRLVLQNGDNSVYIGLGTGENDDKTNNYNVGIGPGALADVTSGYSNIAIGRNALADVTTGGENVAVGAYAAYKITTYTGTTAIGAASQQFGITGQRNTSLGYRSLYFNETGDDNVVIGYNAQYTSSVSDAVIIGYAAGQNNVGSGAVGIGYGALQDSIGNYPVAIGYNALENNTGTSQPVGIGYNTMRNNSGNGVVGVGATALQFNSGDGNTALGRGAGYNTVYQTGSFNTFLGNNSTYSSSASNISNATAVGANITLTDSNTVILGNNAKVGIGTTSPTYMLEVAGTGGTDGVIRSRRMIATGGTAADPAITTVSTIAGLYEPSYGRLGIVSRGQEVIRLINDGSNNMLTLIGTTTGTARLQVKGFGSTSSTTALKVENSSGNSVFEVLDNGSVGIGTSSPDSLLELYSASATDFLKLTSGGSSASPIKLIFEKSAAEQGIIEYNRNGDMEIYNSDPDGGVMINGRYSGSADLYVDNAGNVGIGTTSPTDKLDVSGNIKLVGTQDYLKFANDFVTIKRDGANFMLFNAYAGFKFYDTQASSERMRITSDGNIGIGTTTPSSKLHVTGDGTTSSTTAFKVENANASSSFVIKDDGSVGIGVSSPQSGKNLHIGSSGNDPQGDGRVYVQIGDLTNTTQVSLDFLRSNASQDIGAGYHIPGTNSPHLMWAEGGTPGGEWRINLVGSSKPYYEKAYPTQGNPYKEFGFASGSGTTADGIGAFTPSMVMHYGGNVMIGSSRTAPSTKLHVDGDTTLSGSLYSSRETGSLATGSTLLYQIDTGSYTAGFFDYYATSGSNYRAGNINAVWGNSDIKFTELATPDIGNTSNLQFSMSLSSNYAQLYVSASSEGWTVKTTFRTI